jgi:uncharacterized membrane-anchored protein
VHNDPDIGVDAHRPEVWVSGAVERSPYRLSSHPKVEAFYWTTIMFSQTLGTALGDWMAYADQMA